MKRVPKADRAPEHPLLNPFTVQISAALLIARRIKQECKGETANLVNRFLDEFDNKSVVK